MARLPRFSPAGIPQHIVQRGNNRSICFGGEQDFAAYAKWLEKYSHEFQVEVHAWVFMTNHVHLLVTPKTDGGVSLLMQALGRRYVRYFNYQYQRTGTLWEGRFKSGLVESDRYLLQCYRYIELNPVRAGMVDDPANYDWSSYRHNGLGKDIRLCTPHAEYLKLGASSNERIENYRELFRAHVDSIPINDIRAATNKGLALGSERFKDEIESLYGRRVRQGIMGRPKKIV